MTISAIDSPIEQKHTGKGNPNAVAHFDVPLNNRQQQILDKLTSFDSRVILPKKSVNMSDLSALTAKTGDEFAMFTKGKERLIVRGDYKHIAISPEMASEMAANGYKWSGHTHPAKDSFGLHASDGDLIILEAFNQERSQIYNALGQRKDMYRRKL